MYQQVKGGRHEQAIQLSPAQTANQHSAVRSYVDTPGDHLTRRSCEHSISDSKLHHPLGIACRVGSTHRARQWYLCGLRLGRSRIHVDSSRSLRTLNVRLFLTARGYAVGMIPVYVCYSGERYNVSQNPIPGALVRKSKCPARTYYGHSSVHQRTI